jgi:hypothetical protein
MSNVVEVVEKEYVLKYLVSSFDMNVVITQLNVSATVISNTYDSSNNRLYEKQFVVEGAEYDAWGTDDNYIKNLVASKLGLEIKTIPIAVGDSVQISFDELPQ